MSTQQSRPPSPEEAEGLRTSYRSEVTRAWTLAEVEVLKLWVSQETSYKLFLKYLLPLEEMVQAQVWREPSVDKIRFLQGQHDVLSRLVRMGEELNQMAEILREEQRRQNEVAKIHSER